MAGLEKGTTIEAFCGACGKPLYKGAHYHREELERGLRGIGFVAIVCEDCEKTKPGIMDLLRQKAQDWALSQRGG